MDRKIALLGVPMDLGGGRRGVDMGPSAVRIAGLQEHLRVQPAEYRAAATRPQRIVRVALDDTYLPMQAAAHATGPRFSLEAVS